MTTEQAPRPGQIAAMQAEHARLISAVTQRRNEYQQAVRAKQNGDPILGSGERLRIRAEHLKEAVAALEQFVNDPRTAHILGADFVER